MHGVLYDITIIILIASVLSIVFRYFNQPTILAYLATGIIIGPVGLFGISDKDSLDALGKIGVALMLFMLGLELKLKELRSIGVTAIILGVAQIVITFGLFYLTSVFLGFENIERIYIAFAMSFSSTVIIVKILSDKRDLNSLYGKLSLGLLLMQDFFAVIAILFLASGQPSQLGSEVFFNFLLSLLKLVVIGGWIMVLSIYVFPKIINKVAQSAEILFLVSLAWVFLLIGIVTHPMIGLSVEMGGFLAGLALANTHENFQIIARMKALRDFFIVIFFVLIGVELKITNFSQLVVPVLVLSFLVIFVKPYIVAFSMSLFGYKKRTSLLVGLTNSQISEFSLVLVFMGVSLGVLSDSTVSTVLVVSILTFVGSVYIIQNAKSYTHKLSKFIWLPKAKLYKDIVSETEAVRKNHVVLIGMQQLGRSILYALENNKSEIVIVEFDPDIAFKLKNEKKNIIFGDISDPEIQERAGINNAKLVISTIPDSEDNIMLIESIKHNKSKAKVVCMALESREAKYLYSKGADYVVLPHLVGGKHLAKIIVDDNHLELIEDYKAKDLSVIE